MTIDKVPYDELLNDVEYIECTDEAIESALFNNEDEIKQQLDSLSSQLTHLKNEQEENAYSLSEHIIETTINGILGPFGLSKEMFQDKDGGNVTAQHNASLGIFANEREKYNRKEYNKGFNKAKKQIRESSVKDGKYISAYSGRTYEGTPDIDHGEAVADYHKNYGGWMQTQEQRAGFGGDERNLNVTSPGENRSLGKKNKYSWQEEQSTKDPSQTNKEYYGHDNRRVNAAMKRSEKAVQENAPSKLEKAKYYAGAIGSQALQESAMLAARQALGMALKIFVEESWHIIKDAIRLYREKVITCVKDFIQFIIEKLKNLRANIQGYLTQIGKAAVQGGIAGACSTIITFIINSFITTAKRIVTLIREIISAIANAIKVMIDKNISAEEKKNKVIKILTAALWTAVGIFLVEIVKNALMKIAGLQQFSDELANVIVNIITGILTVLVLYIVMKIQSKRKHDERLAEISNVLFNIRTLSVELMYVSQQNTLNAMYNTGQLLEGSLLYVQQTTNEISAIEYDIQKCDSETQSTLERIENVQSDIDAKLSILRNKHHK